MAYSETIKLRIKSQAFSDITGEVESIVRKSEVQDGLCTIFSVGSTSAVLINENEPMLLQDLRKALDRVAPENEMYQHTENARSHISSSLIGSSQTLPIKDGELILGDWQSIMIANFDVDEREREVIVTIVGG